MGRTSLLCQNAAMPRHSAPTHVLATLLAGLLLLSPSAGAAQRKSSVVALPYAIFPGVPESVGPRLAELLSQDLRGREELKLVELRAPAARSDKSDPMALARTVLGKATQLAQKGRHAAAAEALESAIGIFGANPILLDEAY